MDIQEDDQELHVLTDKLIQNSEHTRQFLSQTNKKILEKNNKIPEEAKIMTDKQYED